METPEKKAFRYSLEIEEIPHTEDTVECALGTDYFNPDFGEDCWAREILGDLFKDAMLQKLHMTMLMIPKDGATEEEMERFEYIQKMNDKRIDQYRTIQESLKLIEIMKKDVDNTKKD
tara:strand:+ start:2949 stop:3302 length:354 start_codon:yes stop_codon:yes gene_type:complete